MTDPAESVRAELSEGILTLTINRPERRNALDSDVWRGLGAQLARAAEDPDVSVLIVTGAGDKAFAAGADIGFLKTRTVKDVLGGLAQDVYESMERLPKPIVAAVNGVALGGGCELALACDIRVAATGARFGQPEVNLAVIPGGGGTQRMVRTVGLGNAKDLLLTGRIIDAAEALRIGLVTRVVEAAVLIAEARSLAAELKSKGPLALAFVKMTAQAAQGGDQRTAMLLERFAQAVATSSEDAREGLGAFLEKRSPHYHGS